MQTMTSPFQEEVRSSIEDRHLLRHPFYVAWSKGELSLEQLRQYAGQYMHHVLAEPTYLGAVHSNTPHFASDGKSDLSMRQAILQNLIDEEFGPENHPALKIDGLRRFYGFTDPREYEFFTVHEEADIFHSAAEWRLIERAADAPAKRAEVLAATSEACEALWSFLGGVYEINGGC